METQSNYLRSLVKKLIWWCYLLFGYWSIYKIKKNHHYSKRLIYRAKAYKEGRHMLFKARFTESCLYKVIDDDIHKLYGFTDTDSLVHENSVRFGWRHDGKGYIEIFAYWYSNGQRGFKKLGETIPGQIDTYEIWAKEYTYFFRFNDDTYMYLRPPRPEHGLRLRLYPYFGGNLVAPNDMTIHIHEIK